MKNNYLKNSALLGFFASICFLLFVAAQAQKEINTQDVPGAELSQQSINLNFNEYSVLNGALVTGLNKFGGEIYYAIKMANTGEEINWILTTSDPSVLDKLSFFLQGKFDEWQSEAKAEPANENVVSALDVVNALLEKVNEAKADPRTIVQNIAGQLTQQNNNWSITTEAGSYTIIGDKVDGLVGFAGKDIVARGLLPVADELQLLSFIEKKENLLELFVMSQCPIALQVEQSLFDYLDNYTEENKPQLDIRYIFYGQQEAGQTQFSSLHGEPEIHENLIQMLIRDRHAAFFMPYLKMRLQDSSSPWGKILAELSLDATAIEAIAQAVVNERDALIHTEYAYVMGQHQVADGSPTFIWESQQVKDIRTTKEFKDLSFAVADASCTN